MVFFRKAVENCRKNGGPVASEEELDAKVTELKNQSEAELKKFLNAEVIYRKVTFLNVKIKHLKLLLKKTILALAATATMEDLNTAIKTCDAPPPIEETPEENPAEVTNPENHLEVPQFKVRKMVFG